MAESTLPYPEYAHTYKPDLTDKEKAKYLYSVMTCA